MRAFWLCFVPLFISVDAIGLLPLFLSLTGGMDAAARRRVVLQSALTATLAALGFLWFGPVLLRFLGVSVPDFMVAGGILLLALSLGDLLTGGIRQREADPESLGAVPIGVPLITGPAVLTVGVLLRTLHGPWIPAAALAANTAFAALVFSMAGPITRVLGRTGAKTASKLASLLLAAIAVMLIRRGIAAMAG